MKFKDFLQKEELQGLYGSPIKADASRVDHALDKDFYDPKTITPSTKKRGGSDIKRMLGSQKTMAKASMPTGELPKQTTLKNNKPGEFFKSPQISLKSTKVKPPLGISSN